MLFEEATLFGHTKSRECRRHFFLPTEKKFQSVHSTFLSRVVVSLQSGGGGGGAVLCCRPFFPCRLEWVMQKEKGVKIITADPYSTSVISRGNNSRSMCIML